MNQRLDHETLKKRLRYQGESYSGGSVSRGGSAEVHYLTQAADYIDELEQQLADAKQAARWESYLAEQAIADLEPYRDIPRPKGQGGCQKAKSPKPLSEGEITPRQL